MKIFRIIISFALAVILLTSCGSSFKVMTDYDRSIDFTKYKTFGIYRLPTNVQNISQLNVERIYASVRATMREKGFTESENPDVWVNSILIVDTREQHSSTTNSTHMGMGMGMGWGMGGMHRPYMWGSPMMMGGPMMMNTTSHTRHHVEVYKVGTLLIDIIDAKTNNLIWHAYGDRKISNSMKKNADETILKYVRKVMSGFPPQTIVHNVTKMSMDDDN